MTTAPEFAKNFEPHAVPAELAKLLDFQEKVGTFEGYSKGFWLERGDYFGLDTWSKDPAFISRFLPFARANGMASIYALWVEPGDANADPAAMDASTFPVVAFGGEGGVNIVAENVRGLLRLLAVDAEPSINGGIWFDKFDEEQQPSEYHAQYVEWLSELGLEPIDDPSTLIAAAQNKHKARFEAWFSQYYDLDA